MEINYSIKVYKQYFNFSAAHFLVYENDREFLHGHNYHVTVKGDSSCLNSDKVFDFLDIKPVVRRVCDSLDHKLILPTENPWIEINDNDSNYDLIIKNGGNFSFPKEDVLLLPLPNVSAERLAMHISYRIIELIKEEFGFEFTSLEVEVEETSGQSATYINRGNR